MSSSKPEAVHAPPGENGPGPGRHAQPATALQSEANVYRHPRNTEPEPLSDEALRIADEAVNPGISPVVIAGFTRLVELLLLVAAGFAVQYAYVYPKEGMPAIYPAAILVGAGLALLAFESLEIYTPHALRSFVKSNGKLLVAWIGVFAVLTLIAFFLKLGDSFSRLWLGLWFVLGFALLVLFRVGLAFLVRRWTRDGRLERRAVIVGGGEPAAHLIEALGASPESDIRICGIFDDRKDDRSPQIVAGYPKLGTVGQLVEFARRTRIDLLIVALPITAEKRVLELLDRLWVLPVDIRLSAHTNKLRFRPRSYSYIGNVPFMDVYDKPIADWDYVLKWLFDRIIGGLILIALLPLMVLIAIAIKLDSRGPVLFRQKRYGFNNELIEVCKFRSMYVEQCDPTASKLVTRNDPRVTRVGRFIRKTSLDELPQLFNVMRGELSLVGPRPHALQAKAADKLYDAVVDGYFARHRVRPGITGWAQVKGWRGETDTPEKIQRRVDFDLDYIENWSVLFDLYILAITPFSLITKKEGAY